jgi:hypothetical protein
VAVLSLAEVVGDVTPQVVGVVGDEPGDETDDGASHGGVDDNGDLAVEDGYEPSNV